MNDIKRARKALKRAEQSLKRIKREVAYHKETGYFMAYGIVDMATQAAEADFEDMMNSMWERAETFVECAQEELDYLLGKGE